MLLLGLVGPIAAEGLSLALHPPEPVQGGLVLIEVRGADGDERATGTCLNRPLRFYRDGRGRLRALCAVPLGQRPGPAPIKVRLVPEDDSPVVLGAPVKVRAGKFGQQTLRVDPRFVSPPASERKRIRQEAAAMGALWRAPPSERQWQGSFVWPRRDAIASAFGLRRMFNGQLRSRHWGLDIDGRLGDPILAMGDGTVVMVAERYYSGGTLVIDHGLRLFSLYFHLSEFAVKPGERVARGQLIGRVGSTGRSTGPHLHLTTKLEDRSFDPTALLEMDLREDDDPAVADEDRPAP
jgi:murein DD-endopeptidase MepM/ murein hydrolase activator NlpD